METAIVKVDELNPVQNSDLIDKAANVLQNGGLVAFPTETVYGIGADAFNAAAALNIYEAKGRPADNPLIVHVSNWEQLQSVISDEPNIITPKAKLLMETFWPGALTLIFKKNKRIPKEATGGLETVAVRWPSNKIANLLIERTGPIAAPSANLSGKPSPTKAEHVINDFCGKIDMILDGGSSDLGLESTVLDLTTDQPVVLRPGSITIEMLQDVIGSVKTENDFDHTVAKAPGMKYTHYSPNAKLTIVVGESDEVIRVIQSLTALRDKKIAILATDQTKEKYSDTNTTVFSLGDRTKPETIAATLFAVLRQLDMDGIEEAYAEGFSENGIQTAIMNRLKKAAGYNIIDAEAK